MRTTISASESAIKKIKANGGLIRTKEAISSGIYPRTINELVKDRKLEIVSRGIYRYGTSNHTDPDLVTVAHGYPRELFVLSQRCPITRSLPRFPIKFMLH